MKKWIFCLCLFLGGCFGHTQPVHIAVPVDNPLPDFPTRPPLEIKTLKAGASCGEVLTAAGKDINMLLRRESAAKKFWEEYKKKK
jgi:hypothetical protein